MYSVEYVPEPEAESGWYVFKDGKTIKGPFSSKLEAEKANPSDESQPGCEGEEPELDNNEIETTTPTTPTTTRPRF